MTTDSEFVDCHTLFGEIKQVTIDRLRLRVSAYGLVFLEDSLLLLRGRYTHRYALPGGGVRLGERLEAALTREIREETGLEVQIERFLHFHEDFFYYDPLDRAFHSLMFYYWCTPLTTELVHDEDVDDQDVEQPRWVSTSGLSAADFQTHGDLTLQLVHMLQKKS